MAIENKQEKPEYRGLMVTPVKPPPGEYITRTTGDAITTQTVYDPYAVQNGQAVKKYGFTAKHPHVAPALKLLEEAPFWSEYHIFPDNDYKAYPHFEDIDRKVIKLIDYQIKSFWYEDFENVLRIIFSDAFIYGFSVSEKIFGWDDRLKQYLIKAIKPHSPFHFDLYTDQGNNLGRIFYRLRGLYIEPQMLNKFIVVPYPYLEHGKYYGTSGLQSIYFDVKVIEILEQALSEGIRRLSIKPMIYYYNGEEMTDDDLKKMKTALYNMDGGSVFSVMAMVDPDTNKSIPRDDIRVLEDRASPDGLALVTDFLDILYRRVNRTLGVPDDLGFTTTAAGSYAKSKEEFSLYDQTIVRNQKFIEMFTNRQIIPSFIKYNYPALYDSYDYNLPQFRFGAIEEDFDLKVIDGLEMLIDKGIINPADSGHAEWLQDKLNIPPMSTAPINVTPTEDEDINSDKKLARFINRMIGRG